MAYQVRLVAIGTRGDVQPYVALGLGLQSAGYDVSVVTTRDFAAFVSAAGLDVLVSPFDLRRSLASTANRRNSRHARMALLDDMLIHLAPLCRGADLILYGTVTSVVMPDVIEYLQIPGIPAFLQPLVHPTAAFPPSLLPRFPFGRWTNRPSYRLMDRLLWFSLRRRVNEWRQDRLGLPPARSGPFQRIEESSAPALYGISPTILPRPADWPSSIHLTGNWFLPTTTGYVPPPELAAFLAEPPAPVFVGFGSMSGAAPKAAMQTVLAAIARGGYRAIVGSGWGEATSASESGGSSGVLTVTDVPYDWLFPRVAAVIHHGGAGTTAEGLRAGKPTLIIPTGGDQPFWGDRVAALGAGPRPISRRRLSERRLQPALQQLLTDLTIQTTAADLGEQIRREDGVANAVRIIHSFHAP